MKRFALVPVAILFLSFTFQSSLAAADPGCEQAFKSSDRRDLTEFLNEARGMKYRVAGRELQTGDLVSLVLDQSGWRHPIRGLFEGKAYDPVSRTWQITISERTYSESQIDGTSISAIRLGQLGAVTYAIDTGKSITRVGFYKGRDLRSANERAKLDFSFGQVNEFYLENVVPLGIGRHIHEVSMKSAKDGTSRHFVAGTDGVVQIVINEIIADLIYVTVEFQSHREEVMALPIAQIRGLSLE